MDIVDGLPSPKPHDETATISFELDGTGEISIESVTEVSKHSIEEVKKLIKDKEFYLKDNGVWVASLQLEITMIKNNKLYYHCYRNGSESEIKISDLSIDEIVVLIAKLRRYDND